MWVGQFTNGGIKMDSATDDFNGQLEKIEDLGRSQGEAINAKVEQEGHLNLNALYMHREGLMEDLD